MGRPWLPGPSIFRPFFCRNMTNRTEDLVENTNKSDFHNGFLQYHSHSPPRSFVYKRSKSFSDGVESQLKSDPKALLKVLLGDYFGNAVYFQHLNNY